MSSATSKNAYAGKTGAQMQAEQRADEDARPVLTRCAFCSWWVFDGTAAEGRVEAAGHRADKHPDIKPVRRRRNRLQRFSHGDDSFRQEGLERAAEVAALHARREAAA